MGFFEEIVNYFNANTQNKILCIAAIAIAVILIVLIIVAIVLGAKKSKRKKAEQEAAAQEEATAVQPKEEPQTASLPAR